MEDGDAEKYHPSSVIQDFVFPSRKSSCIGCISLQVYSKFLDHARIQKAFSGGGSNFDSYFFMVDDWREDPNTTISG